MMVMMAVMMMVIWSWYFHQPMKKRAGALSTLSWQEWNVTSFNIWYRYQLASLGKRLKQEIYFEYLTNIFSTIHVATVLYDIFLSQQWAIILIRPRRRWSWERIFVRSWRVSKDFISNEIFCWNAESSLVNTLKTPTSLRGNRNIISFVCKWSWRDDDLDYAAVWTSVALISKKLDVCCCGNFFVKTFHSDILIIHKYNVFYGFSLWMYIVIFVFHPGTFYSETAFEVCTMGCKGILSTPLAPSRPKQQASANLMHTMMVMVSKMQSLNSNS